MRWKVLAILRALCLPVPHFHWFFFNDKASPLPLIASPLPLEVGLILADARNHHQTTFTSHSNLLVENDSSDSIAWVASSVVGLWKFHFLLSEIKMLSFASGV